MPRSIMLTKQAPEQWRILFMVGPTVVHRRLYSNYHDTEATILPWILDEATPPQPKP